MDAFDLLLLGAGLLMFLTLLAGVVSARLGLSFLLVFLVAGMLVGEDGPVGIHFDSPQLAYWVGTLSLAIILLEGGVGTSPAVFRAGRAPAALLASVGVLVTAVLVGMAAMSLMGLDPPHALLLGAIVGSTDAAAVFSLLRQAGLRLPERLAATLEIESGLNDPMAVFLVLAMIALVQHHAGPVEIALLLARQAGFGALLGWGGGTALAWGLRRLKVGAEHGGLLSLVILSGGIALFGLAGLVGGSGFLAVYLFGVRLRAKAEEAAHAASSALDGFAWGAQATMFVLLGLLVTPHEMLSALPVALLIAAMLVFIARPLAVWLCLAPLGFPLRQSLFVGWVGLRGAVPIVLALFPLLDHVPGTARYFHIAFAVVLVSLLLQGTTLRWVAQVLRVTLPAERPPGEQPPMLGRLTLDGELAVEDVFSFFELPQPEAGGVTLRDWMAASLARGHGKGDSVEWHGARFEIVRMHEDRIQRVALVLDRAALSGQARG